MRISFITLCNVALSILPCTTVFFFHSHQYSLMIFRFVFQSISSFKCSAGHLNVNKKSGLCPVNLNQFQINFALSICTIIYGAAKSIMPCFIHNPCPYRIVVHIIYFVLMYRNHTLKSNFGII